MNYKLEALVVAIAAVSMGVGFAVALLALQGGC